MASRRASRSASEGGFAPLLGVVGRKTGIAPKSNVLKDADDMDNVDDWFASSDEEMPDEQMEQEEEVEEEEVEEEMEESPVNNEEEEAPEDQEPSFIALSPPARQAISVFDQSLLNVTPIRPSRPSTFNEQDSVLSPELTPSPPSRAAVMVAPRAATIKSGSTAAPARVQPPTLRLSRSPSPPPEEEPALDDANVSGFGDTSGYSSPQPSMAYEMRSMHSAAASTFTSVDSVHTPPPPKVLLKDSTVHESTKRGKRAKRDASSMELSGEAEPNSDESEERGQVPATRPTITKRRKDSSDDEEPAEQKKTTKRSRKQSEDDLSEEEQRQEGKAAVKYARHAKLTKDTGVKQAVDLTERKGRTKSNITDRSHTTGRTSRGRKRGPEPDESLSPASRDSEEEGEEEREEKEEITKSKRSRILKPSTSNGESKRRKDRAEPDMEEEELRNGRRKDKARIPSTPSPPPSPGFAAEASLLSSSSGPVNITITGEASMDTGSFDTERYVTVPLKDHSASPHRSRDESNLDMTNYEEMPTFVDPNDETWAANESLEEEVANLPPVRRSARKRIKPLAYWKNERVVYGFNEGENMRSVTDVVQVKTPQAKKNAKKAQTKGKSKRDASGRKKTSSSH